MKYTVQQIENTHLSPPKNQVQPSLQLITWEAIKQPLTNTRTNKQTKQKLNFNLPKPLWSRTRNQ